MTTSNPVYEIILPAGQAAQPTQPAAPAQPAGQATHFVERPIWGSGGAGQSRREQALSVRQRAALLAYNRPHPAHSSNGDEQRYASKIGNFSKGLPHNQLGETDQAAYASLLAALESKQAAAFEAIQLGRGRKLTSPQAGLAFELEGPDAQAVTMPPAPAIASAEAAAEMAELYEMALLRDLPFTQFGAHAEAAAASASLSALADFRGPRQAGHVTPATLFRGFTRGDLIGPYVSQFLLRDVPYGSLNIAQLNQTVPAENYMTDYASWLEVQNGDSPQGPRASNSDRRYMYNMRMLTHYVHIDELYEAYLNAALILGSLNANNALVDAGNPYKRSATQIGFATFGGPHILSLVTEVATRALKAVWFQKWFVHRRLRPEAYGGLVHNRVHGRASYPIHDDLLRSRTLDRVCARNGAGSYLLPMAFKEGSPTHPAYGAGHATVAGACVTILKAWYDETFVLPDPVQANDDGTRLIPYAGADAGLLTVGNELNKLAANIGIGRNMAGVHWRSDYTESLRLGERVAIGILEEQSLLYNEPSAFTFTTFDGRQVLIRDGRTSEIA